MSTNQSEAFIGQGKVFMAAIIGGVKQPQQWIGDASALSFAHEISDKRELYESHTGTRQLYDSTDGKKKTTFSLTLTERKKDALQIVLQAEKETVAAVTGATATSPVNIAAGDYFQLAASKVSNVTVVDSNATPQALVLGVDYELDADFGMIKVLNVDTLTLPLVATYDSGAKTQFKPLTNEVDGYEIVYNCINEAGLKEKSIVLVPKAKPDPASAFDLINDDFSTLELTGECLYDAALEGSYSVNYPD